MTESLKKSVDDFIFRETRRPGFLYIGYKRHYQAKMCARLYKTDIVTLPIKKEIQDPQ